MAFDLADPDVPGVAPPAYLLRPAMVALVLLPLGLSALLQQALARVEAQSGDAQARAEALQERQRDLAVARTRIEELESVLAGVAALRAGNAATIALVSAATGHLPPGARLSGLSVDASGVRIAGSVEAASDVSQWLARSAGRDPALLWGAPEIRDASAGDGRVDFGVRVRRVTPVASKGAP